MTIEWKNEFSGTIALGREAQDGTRCCVTWKQNVNQRSPRGLSTGTGGRSPNVVVCWRRALDPTGRGGLNLSFLFPYYIPLDGLLKLPEAQTLHLWFGDINIIFQRVGRITWSGKWVVTSCNGHPTQVFVFLLYLDQVEATGEEISQGSWGTCQTSENWGFLGCFPPWLGHSYELLKNSVDLRSANIEGRIY